MQDSPALLPALYEAVTKEGFDCAAVRRATREGEPRLRSFFARRFYGMMGKCAASSCRGSPGLPPDDPADDRRRALPAGSEPLLEGHLFLGGLQDQVAGGPQQ
jgi:hypothetical protein